MQQIYLTRKSPCISVFRGFSDKRPYVCGVQIEILGELWSFPCVTYIPESIYLCVHSLLLTLVFTELLEGPSSFHLDGCGLS